MAATRVKITLACTECESRNYNATKNRQTHPERVEFRKYCRRCDKHTKHKETK
jgi:large subunit ribosomal protein L33